MFRKTNRLRRNYAVMYKSVDDLIQNNKRLIGSTKISKYGDLQKKYFIKN